MDGRDAAIIGPAGAALGPVASYAAAAKDLTNLYGEFAPEIAREVQARGVDAVGLTASQKDYVVKAVALYVGKPIGWLAISKATQGGVKPGQAQSFYTKHKGREVPRVEDVSPRARAGWDEPHRRDAANFGPAGVAKDGDVGPYKKPRL